MTSFEQLESDMRSGCPQDVLRCDIANALLDANTTDQEIQQIFSFYGTRRFIDFPLFCQCVEAYIEQQRISRLLTPASCALSRCYHTDSLPFPETVIPVRGINMPSSLLYSSKVSQVQSC